MKPFFAVLMLALSLSTLSAYGDNAMSNVRTTAKVAPGAMKRNIASVAPVVAQSDPLAYPKASGFVSRIKSFFRMSSVTSKPAGNLGEDSNTAQPVADLQREQSSPVSSEFQKISEAASEIDEATSGYSAVAARK
jgi:hypothetical protein